VPNLAAALINASKSSHGRNIDGINLQGFLVGALPPESNCQIISASLDSEHRRPGFVLDPAGHVPADAFKHESHREVTWDLQKLLLSNQIHTLGARLNLTTPFSELSLECTEHM
jgi:hypothetical protein